MTKTAQNIRKLRGEMLTPKYSLKPSSSSKRGGYDDRMLESKKSSLEFATKRSPET